MILKPPPFNEPLRIDDNGYMTSTAWILWLQDLVSQVNIEELFTGAMFSQSSDTASTGSSGADDAMMFTWMSY